MALSSSSDSSLNVVAACLLCWVAADDLRLNSVRFADFQNFSQTVAASGVGFLVSIDFAFFPFFRCVSSVTW